MLKLAANLSMMFNEVPFLQRFDEAAKAGFKGVEFLFPYAFSAADIKDKLQQNNLTQVLFNMPPGNWDNGDRGMACLPDRVSECRENMHLALEYAEHLGCDQVHLMSGLKADNVSFEKQQETYLDNVAHAAELAAPKNINILIEPINPVDMPGYFLNDIDFALSLLKQLKANNVYLQLDLYHCQIIHGDLARNIDKFLPYSRHIQIAGVPERHEPDIGEVNYLYLFDKLQKMNYERWIGCEYRPRDGSNYGLGWAEKFGITAETFV